MPCYLYRAIHTNFKAMFKCDSLLLAMIKTERLAKLLFGESGSLYDCVCKVRLRDTHTLSRLTARTTTHMATLTALRSRHMCVCVCLRAVHSRYSAEPNVRVTTACHMG